MHRVLVGTAILFVALGGSAAAAAGPQITVLAGQASGDYDSGSDTERQSATVRLAWGDDTRLRLDLDFLRVNSELGVTSTPFAVVPTHRGQGPQGPGGQGGQGQGSSSGTEPAPVPDPTLPTTTATEWASGPGDLRLTLSRRLIGGGAKLFRLDAEVGAKLPTADDEKRLGTGELDGRLGLAAQRRFWSLTAFSGLGWNSLGDPEWIELQDVLDVYLGLESEPLAAGVVISGWLEANEEVVAGTGSRSALGLGIRSTGKIGWRAQLSAGLSDSAEDFSLLVGASFGVSNPAIGSRKVG